MNKKVVSKTTSSQKLNTEGSQMTLETLAVMMSNSFAGFEKRMNERFEKVDVQFQKIDAQFKKVDLQFEKVRSDMLGMHDKFTTKDAVAQVNSRVLILEKVKK